MKITKKYLMKVINEETSVVLREKRPKIKFTRARARKGKRQLELYKTLGADFGTNERMAIKQHQAMLAMMGYGFMMPKSFGGGDGDIYGETADGIYGPETAGATAAFQKTVGENPDGLYGKKTHAKALRVLNADLTPVGAPDRVMQHLTRSKAQGGMGIVFDGAVPGDRARATDVGRQGDEVEASEETPTGVRGFGRTVPVPGARRLKSEEDDDDELQNPYS